MHREYLPQGLAHRGCLTHSSFHLYTDAHDRPHTAAGPVGKENIKQTISILLISAGFKEAVFIPALVSN